jgi:hypothetical protein
MKLIEPFRKENMSLFPGRTIGTNIRKAENMTNRCSPLKSRVTDQDEDVLKQLDEVVKVVSGFNAREAHQTQCNHAADVLRRCYEDYGTTPMSWPQVAWWPFQVSPEYLHLLLTKDSVALMLFRCWCRYVRNAPPRWFLEGWSHEAIGSIERLLIA